jgi:hypothetical protein
MLQPISAHDAVPCHRLFDIARLEAGGAPDMPWPARVCRIAASPWLSGTKANGQTIDAFYLDFVKNAVHPGRVGIKD